MENQKSHIPAKKILVWYKKCKKYYIGGEIHIQYKNSFKCYYKDKNV